MQIKYVGAKQDGETAFAEKTGITWFPGDSHAVDDKVAARMLNHPDVFAVDEGNTVVTLASTPLAPSTPVAKEAHGVFLFGSDKLPALVPVGSGSTTVELAAVVASAFLRSGHGVDDWNTLSAEDRETLLANEVIILGQDSGGGAGDGVDVTPVLLHLEDGTTKDIAGLDKDALVALAAELKVRHHPNAGVAKITEALVKAFPAKA
ncbi:hypothetical protein [uncultured Rhodoferax sp.]|uniref:hypothetical protein n=1 Tax=uncultured Rhodoferax sp. TaxID=223188 RepID=UPI0025EBD0E8|nr:hypothetical protein [uncultured Rhodoferax sp.]